MGRTARLAALSPALVAALILGMFLLPPRASSAARASEYGEKLCSKPGYKCVTVDYVIQEYEVKTRDGAQTRTKKLFPTWERMWPDEAEREIVMRVNRMNLRLRLGYVLAVPEDMAGKTYMDFSPFPRKIQGHGEKLVVYDPAILAWAAYDPKGELLRWGPAAGGKDFCPDIGRQCHTRVGKYRITYKGGRWYKSNTYPVGCKGASCATLPYFMHFAHGCGFHHSSDVPGKNASHGCVRIYFEDAEWLSKEFVEIGTKVRVRPYPEDE